MSAVLAATFIKYPAQSFSEWATEKTTVMVDRYTGTHILFQRSKAVMVSRQINFLYYICIPSVTHKDCGRAVSSSVSTTGKKPAQNSKQQRQEKLKESAIRAGWWLFGHIGTEDATGHASSIVRVDDEGSTGKGARSPRHARFDTTRVIRIALRTGGKIHGGQPRVHGGVVVVATLRSTIEAGCTVVDMDAATIHEVAIGASSRIGIQIRKQIGL